MTASQGSDKYAFDNLRFRKAYVRERLASLKVERDNLMAERERVDAMLNVKKSEPSKQAQAAPEPVVVRANQAPDAKIDSAKMFTRLRTFSVNGSARG